MHVFPCVEEQKEADPGVRMKMQKALRALSVCPAVITVLRETQRMGRRHWPGFPGGLCPSRGFPFGDLLVQCLQATSQPVAAEAGPANQLMLRAGGSRRHGTCPVSPAWLLPAGQPEKDPSGPCIDGASAHQALAYTPHRGTNPSSPGEAGKWVSPEKYQGEASN